LNAAERAALLEWVQLHRCCAVCHWPESDGRRGLEVHHLMGGSARKHDIRNYLRLCSRCHGVLHSGKVYALQPDLNNRILLGCKQECDPENYDPEYLAWLRHKKHLGYDPEPLPQYYADQRQKNIWKSRNP